MPSGVNKPVRKARKWIYGAVYGSLFVGLLVVAALFFSEALLCVENAPSRADAIVVLGGDPVFRPARAVELFQQQFAPKVVISGDGDCDEVSRALAVGNVSSNAIVLECRSGSTKENAEFTVRLLRQQGARGAILVTSWFHSRRALQCFRHCAPEMQFVSLPTIADRPKSHWPNPYDRARVQAEYLKLGWYWVRYGIAPF